MVQINVVAIVKTREDRKDIAELALRSVDPAVAVADTEPMVALGAPRSTLPFIDSE